MGNAISNNTSGLVYNDPLGNYVKRWGLKSYKPNPIVAPHARTNTLKKRACCTGQQNVYIPFPGVDGGKNIVSVAVGIPVFESRQDINPQNCMFEDDTGRVTTHMSKSEAGNVYSDAPSCQSFYSEFCNGVRRGRLMYDKEDYKSYGLLPDKKEGYTQEYQVNAYIDCNCENSFYKTEYDLIQQESPMLDADTLAQTLDQRCAGQSDKTFKSSIKKMANLCFNYVNLSYINISDDGVLGVNQSCEVSSGDGTKAPVINKVVAPTCKDQFIQQSPGSSLKKINPDFDPKCIPKGQPASSIITNVDNSVSENRKLYFVIGGIGFIVFFMGMLFFMSSKGKPDDIDFSQFQNFTFPDMDMESMEDEDE